ncbi:hypothetical protein ACE1AT_24525 [Pelatocladus sp. BLCC-F211]|uniref:hypothetical protein n=1 Tax=Pelatocladus sp. BLCC-F211 TaxID=3342752 RepID=UPI0035B87CCA
MANSLSNWQDSLNNGLVNRLTRPLRQPRMMKMAMSQRIINRCDRFLNRLPLLNQQMQRWGNTNSISSESIPIVYAQPVSLAKEEGIDNRVDNFLPTVPQNQPDVPLIQRKLDSSQSLPSKIVNNTIPIQNSTNLSSSDFGDKTNQSWTLETQIHQHSISSSEIPVVTPQAISDELTKTSEMPLQAKFTDSQTSSSLNTNIPSTPILDAEINTTSISSSESSIVFPQVISEELVKTSEMPFAQEYVNISQQPLPIIQAKLPNSSISPLSLPVVHNLHTLDSSKQTQINNYSQNLELIKQQILESNFVSTSLPIVTAQSPNYPANLSNERISSAIALPIYQNQPTSIINKLSSDTYNPEINQNHHNQNISPLTHIYVTSPINPPLQSQSLPLPLVKTTPSSRSISQQPNLSNQNPKVSTTDYLSSPPKIFSSPLSTPETSISPIATQSNIDVDSIANQVERKLMRRLVIESERRGKIR